MVLLRSTESESGLLTSFLILGINAGIFVDRKVWLPPILCLWQCLYSIVKVWDIMG